MQRTDADSFLLDPYTLTSVNQLLFLHLPTEQLPPHKGSEIPEHFAFSGRVRVNYQDRFLEDLRPRTFPPPRIFPVFPNIVFFAAVTYLRNWIYVSSFSSGIQGSYLD
jgi:hypothetical protein